MRSKSLIVSNILGTIYAIYLLWFFGGAVIESGGLEFVKSYGAIFKFIGFSSASVNVFYVIATLLIVHICTFTIGSLLGWIGYLDKKSGPAKFAGVLYLVGTICFPIYVFFGLPITIVGFVGAKNQKKINLAN